MKTLDRKKMILRMKLYRFFAVCFVIGGFVLFIMAYDRLAEGNFRILVEQPIEALILFIPFIPAIVLSKLAARAKEKLQTK